MNRVKLRLYMTSGEKFDIFCDSKYDTFFEVTKELFGNLKKGDFAFVTFLTTKSKQITLSINNIIAIEELLK